VIEIQDIFGEKSISVQVSEKEFIDPRTVPLATVTDLPIGGAGCRATMTRMRGKPSPSGSQPPSNSSTISPVFILLLHAVGG